MACCTKNRSRVGFNKMKTSSRCLMVLALCIPALGAAQPADTVRVSARGPVTTVTRALSLVKQGGVILVAPGRYSEPLILVTKPVAIVGQGMPTFDGLGAHGI